MHVQHQKGRVFYVFKYKTIAFASFLCRSLSKFHDLSWQPKFWVSLVVLDLGSVGE